jgi:acetate---CoA ligase (ADP-forming)
VGIRHAAAEEIDPDSPSPSLPYPLAVKVLSRAIAHKTEVGGVVLGVQGRAELVEALRRIRDAVSRKGLEAGRFLVQAMARGVGEALVGYRIDPQAGPLVMVAVGGTLAEVYRDRSLRLAPVDLATAREMVNEVKGFAALAGYRGQARGDLEALAGAVAALSNLAVAAGPPVMEAELNPVVVLEQGKGIVAVDALVRVRR